MKEVYNPEADKTKKAAKPEKLKGDPPKPAKPEKTEAKTAKSSERKKIPKANEMEGDILEFEIPKGLNAYGFIHIPKKAIAFLPFNAGEKLHGHIDTENQTLVISKA